MAKPTFFGIYLGLAKNDNFVKYMDVYLNSITVKFMGV